MIGTRGSKRNRWLFVRSSAVILLVGCGSRVEVQDVGEEAPAPTQVDAGAASVPDPRSSVTVVRREPFGPKIDSGAAPDSSVPDSSAAPDVSDPAGIDAGPTAPVPHTSVSGVIASDTIWSTADAPYKVVGGVVILAGAQLTIEAGVKVVVDGQHPVNVRGKLSVKGTSTDPVVFTSTTPTSRSWPGIYLQSAGSVFARADIDGAIIEYADNGILVDNGGSLKITSSVFRNNHVALDGNHAFAGHPGFETIEDCEFHDNDIAISGGNKVVRTSMFRNNEEALYLVTRTEIYDSTIKDNVRGVSGGCQVTVQRCLITGNSVGIDTSHSEGVSATDNSIVKNETGIETDGRHTKIEGNNICDNLDHNLKLMSNDAVVPDNWWCTTDKAVIDSLIFDVFDDANLGFANYEPFRTSPVPTAPPLP